jgi:hypothetical protein
MDDKQMDNKQIKNKKVLHALRLIKFSQTKKRLKKISLDGDTK